MHKFVSFGPLSHVKIRSVLIAATALLMAGCSNSIERFQSAYNNPSDADPVYTASVPKSRKIAYRPPAVDTQDYAQDETIIESPVHKARVPMAPVANINAQKPYDYAAGYKPAYKQARLVPPPAATYSKPRLIAPPVEQQDAMVDETPVQPVYRAAKPKAALVQDTAEAVSADKTVRVGSGMTLASIARGNGVSVPDLIAANNLQAPFTVRQGQVLLVPQGQVAVAKPHLVQPAEQVAETMVAPKAPTRKIKFNQTAVLDDTTTVEPVAQKPMKKLSAGTNYTVASGDTLYSVGRKFGVSPFVIADANGFAHNSALPLGQEIRVPGAKSAIAPATVADNTTPVVVKPTKKSSLALPAEDQAQAQADANSEPAIGDQQAAVKPVKIKEPAVAPVVASTAMNLRWPLKGKIISGYGPKPDGMKNEGINIAVPEGTSIRAADDGVVAYAGNELKGYGNLVLIRHAGGFVTAYAHAKQLMVKRGDTVKRGDVIGLAGQTGAVTSPQLHFEVRKGAAALDPLKYISTSTASN